MMGRPRGSKNKAKAEAPVVDEAPEGDEHAPGLGHNQLTEGGFLRWVQRLSEEDAKVEAAKLILKNARGRRKDLRTQAAGDGMVMGELDEALADLATERVDLEAKEERRRLYRTWLKLPVGANSPAPKDDAEAEALRWRTRGDQDGRLGKVREAPDGCPPERLQDYLQGHDSGYEALMRGSPLLADGFGAKAVEEEAEEPEEPEELAQEPAAEEAPLAEPAAETVLVLTEADFEPDTPLEDANLRTLLPERRDDFGAAERVVALFGPAKRVLAEPDPNLPGGRYEDNGTTAPISDIEEIAPSGPTAAELA